MHIEVNRCNILKQIEEAQPGETPRPCVYLVREDAPEGTEVFGMAVARPNEREWRILDGPMVSGVDPTWNISLTGKTVRVPLFSYLTEGAEPEILAQFAMAQSVRALHLTPRDKPVSKVFIIIGNVFQRSDGKPGYEVWLGFAYGIE